MSEPRDCSARADGAWWGEGDVCCDSLGSGYRRPWKCVGIRPRDFNAEIHLVQASHHTEGKPRSVAVKWLVYSHNHVIIELGKQHTLLLPVQIISTLHCIWRPWWRRGVKWWCYDRCLTLKHCVLLLMKAVSLKEIVFHFTVWCYLLVLDMRQPASVSRSPQETPRRMEKLFFHVGAYPLSEPRKLATIQSPCKWFWHTQMTQAWNETT